MDLYAYTRTSKKHHLVKDRIEGSGFIGGGWHTWCGRNLHSIDGCEGGRITYGEAPCKRCTAAKADADAEGDTA